MSESRELRNIETTQLHTAHYHKRTHWGDMSALTASVKANGVIEPPVVRVAAHGYEVICGERRRRAAVAAGIGSIDCIVVDVTLAVAIQMQIEENRNREGLHPMDEALYFEDLTKLGFDPGDIAARFQLKPGQVKRRLRLCSLVPAARESFVTGVFDEDAALAIALLDDTNKQAAILAAVTSGALMPEEIAAYCRREHTASLEDVPWRVSDDAYKGGACTACPKRSTVQRDLFDEMRGDRCLDLACYTSKMDDSWRAASSADGVTAYDGDTPSLFIPQSGGRPAVMRSSQMVDAEAPCPHMLGHTWSEAVAKSVKPGTEPPTKYIARDQDGRPRYLFREPQATRVIKKSDVGQPIEDTTAVANPKADARAETRIRRAVLDQIAERIADSDFDSWGWIVERVIDMASKRAVAGAAAQLEDAIAELGVDMSNPGNGEAGLRELVRKSNRRAKQVALAVLVREEADVTAELPPSLRELASECDVDVKAIEKQIRKEHR